MRLPYDILGILLATLLVAGCSDPEVASGSTGGTSGTEAGNALAVRLMMTDGTPAASASLQVWPQASSASDTLHPAPALQARTDAQGRAVLHLPPGLWSVVAQKDGFAIRRNVIRDTVLDGRLLPMSTLTGTVKNRPYSWIALPGLGRSVRADANGNFRFDSIPTGVTPLVVLSGSGRDSTATWLDTASSRTISIDPTSPSPWIDTLPAATLDLVPTETSDTILTDLPMGWTIPATSPLWDLARADGSDLALLDSSQTRIPLRIDRWDPSRHEGHVSANIPLWNPRLPKILWLCARREPLTGTAPDGLDNLPPTLPHILSAGRLPDTGDFTVVLRIARTSAIGRRTFFQWDGSQGKNIVLGWAGSDTLFAVAGTRKLLAPGLDLDSLPHNFALTVQDSLLLVYMDGQQILSLPNDLAGARPSWEQPAIGGDGTFVERFWTGTGLRSETWLYALSCQWL
jgi:hypothetical protein